MTGLLVSVRNEREAILALDAGAQIIDVKEPSRGSLGRPDARTLDDVLRAVDGRVPVSVAGGELRDWDSSAPAITQCGAELVKVGLSGCALDARWADRLALVLSSFHPETAPVAVYYADQDAASSPSFDEILAVCGQLEIRWLLVDTFEKRGTGLVDTIAWTHLQGLAATCRLHQMKLTLAGSLTKQVVPRILELNPNYIGVRGAVCRAGRESRIEADRIIELVQLVAD